jgi:hypothetical protein
MTSIKSLQNKAAQMQILANSRKTATTQNVYRALAAGYGLQAQSLPRAFINPTTQTIQPITTECFMYGQDCMLRLSIKR